jgi:hypothetical protein
MRSEVDHKADKNAKKEPAEGVETQADDIILDDIDPADFFDPEEFGYRRKPNASRP